MSSPVPEFNFARPNPKRPLTLGKGPMDINSTKFSDLNRFKNSVSPFMNKELERLQVYGLNISNDDDEAETLLTDPKSPFFATNKSRRLKNKDLLPYKTETVRDQYKYLSHIIAHIYISAKSLDLKGNLTISVEDLEAARDTILNCNDQSAFINSATGSIEGQKFETLHANQSEAMEDDENEEDSDYYVSSEDEDDEDAENSTPIMKVEPESASIISLKYWTKELKNLLKMGLFIPLEITKKLIQVYYSICLSRGQTIDITFYTQALTLLTKEKKLLVQSGFILDWEPVYNEFSSTLGNPTTFGPTMNDKRYKKLISFALTVKPFFEVDCISLVMEKIMMRTSNQTISSSLIHLTVMLPMNFKKHIIDSDGTVQYDKNDIRFYLPILFDLWLSNKSDKEINCILTIIMNISVESLKQGAEDNSLLYRGKYGVFTKDQFTFMLNQLFLSSQIRHKDSRMLKYCKTISQIIINSLNCEYAFENEGVIDFLKTYADAVYTMIHPSNSGPWSLIIAEVVKKLAISLHLRVQGEKENRDLVPIYHPNYTGLPENLKLNDKVIESVVNILLPLIHLGSQSKSSSNRRRYNEALQVLCFMQPNLVLDKLLPDWYSSFESVNSTHRIPIVITQLTQLARLIVQLPVYRIHIARFLSMLLPAIDSNDPEKTILTTDFITAVAAVTPFADLTENSGDGGLCAIDFTTQHLTYLESKFYQSAPANAQFGDQEIPDSFQYDPEYELEALKSASSSFKEFLNQFCDNCFKFLEVAPEMNPRTIESQACTLISYTFEALIDSMSDELNSFVADKVFDYVTNNVIHEVAPIFCNISEPVVRRNPTTEIKRYMEFFMPQIYEEIKHGAGVSRSQEVFGKDQRLNWNIKILLGAVSGSGAAILPYLPELQNFVLSHINKLRGTSSVSVALLANITHATISYLRPLERRLISKEWLAEHNGKYTEECWGGFQFSNSRFDKKYLDFEWYEPSAKEVKAVSDLFESIASPSLDLLNIMISKLEGTDNVTLEEIDQIGIHIELLEALIKGVCCLFDQSYTELPENKHLGKLKSTFGRAPLSSSPSLVNVTNATYSSSSNDNALPMGGSTSYVGNNDSNKDDMMVVDDEGINPMTKQLEVKIEKSESSTDLSSISVEMESEMPTRSATPGLTDSIEVVDASLTKRGSILYSYGPYFSNEGFSKLMDPSYQVLHSNRNKIGTCLHRLVKALAKREGYVDLTGKVIQCIGTWLNDCGYYSSDNEVYIDNLHFVSLLDFPGVFAPYTRTILASRLAVYHCSRINISCCTRLPTPLDKILLKDLVSLVASPYTATSAPAATILGTSLNRIMNCTSVIFSIFKNWEKALLDKDHDTLVNVLYTFDKKKLRGVVEKSSSMLPKYEDLLFKSAELNEERVTYLSMTLLGSIKKYVKVPAVVCIFDEKVLECIRPPDSDADLKVSSLKLAKSKKKVLLGKALSDLVKVSISRLSKKLNWKFVMFVLELITTIESHIEIPLERDVLSTMLKYVDGSHPDVSKKGMFWIASVMDTVESRGFHNYNLSNMLALDPEDPTIIPFENICPENTTHSFFKEIQNIESPKFFIDNKQWIPVNPWNKELKVVKHYNRSGFNFNQHDETAVKQFAAGISKEWLLTLLKTHIDESESTAAFFPGIVYFFSSIVTLILFGYLENLNIKDIFDITDEIFKGDERPTHVAVSEVFCGILFACKNNENAMKVADEEITKRVRNIFDTALTQSTYKMWSIFSWWLASHFDLRRTPLLLNLICDFEVENDTKKSPFPLMCRLTFLKSYMGSVTNRYHNFDEITHRMFNVLAHPYDIVSGEVSAILFDILLYRNTDETDSFDDYLSKIHQDKTGLGTKEHKKNIIFHEHLKLFFIKTLRLADENENKTPQEVANSDFMYHIKGLSALLLRILKTSLNPQLTEYIVPYILPLVLELDKVRDACSLAGISVDAFFLILGSIRFREEEQDTIIELLASTMGWPNPKITQYKHVLAFFGVYGTVRFLERNFEQRKKLMEITYSMLFNQHLYLREQYGHNFKIFIHLFLDSEREKVIKFYIKKFKRIIKKNKQEKNVKLTIEQNNLVHGATLGLCALVEAYPYTTPPPKWLPEVLTILEVKCTTYTGATGRAAKDTLSQFKKTRQDTWHIDSKFFTEEQLEDLEGVLYKSYYL